MYLCLLFCSFFVSLIIICSNWLVFQQQTVRWTALEMCQPVPASTSHLLAGTLSNVSSFAVIFSLCHIWMTSLHDSNSGWNYRMSQPCSFQRNLNMLNDRYNTSNFYLQSVEAWSVQSWYKWQIAVLDQDGWKQSASLSDSLIWLSGFPVRFCLFTKTEADGASALHKEQLIGVDSAWSVLTFTWLLSQLRPLCRISAVRCSTTTKPFTTSLNPVPMETCSLVSPHSSDT